MSQGMYSTNITDPAATSRGYPTASWWVRTYPHSDPFPPLPKADWTELARSVKEALEARLETEKRRLQAERARRMETGKEERPMKSVYNVMVVTKRGEIILDKKVVAKDRDEALFEADASQVLKAFGYRPGDVTMLCVKLGDVEVEPEPQRVQIVEPGPRRDRDDRPPQPGRFNG